MIDKGNRWIYIYKYIDYHRGWEDDYGLNYREFLKQVRVQILVQVVRLRKIEAWQVLVWLR
jgi:hypothetical protein